MNPQRQERLREALRSEFDFKEANGWFKEGKCPNCGKRELYGPAEKPWWVKCNRENKCGFESDVKALYPREFEDFNQIAPPTPSNPNATAEAYLSEERGFDLKRIKGWWSQEHYSHYKSTNGGTATVRFWIDRDAGVYFERLIKTLAIQNDDGSLKDRKANFCGSFKNLWWQPPGQTITKGDRVFLVEGIFDAIALVHHGYKACALLTDRHYPSDQFDKHPGVEWVFALDPDLSGSKWMATHVERARDEGLKAIAAVIPSVNNKKVDWNDLHRLGRIDQATLNEAFYRGRLLTAQSAEEKAITIWRERNRSGFAFEFKRRTYWFEFDLKAYTAAVDRIKDAAEADGTELSQEDTKEQAIRDSGTVAEIATCDPEFLYFQRSPQTDESWYFARVNYPTGGSITGTFTAGQLTAASDFKKRLLHLGPGGHWSGKGFHLDHIVKQRTEKLMTVETIDFVGYSAEHRAWLFTDRAIQEGRVIPINRDEYFELARGVSVKSLSTSTELAIGNRDNYFEQWPDLVYSAYGVKGLVAAVFWFASLYAEHTRSKFKDFPFLEIVGEPGAGKTTLVEFLWRTFGRREEGFDPSKSTAAARARRMGQVSAMPVVLIEADRDDDTSRTGRFDWEELKSLYDGRSPRARGVKNSGNETYEPPFRGAIVVAQNAPVNASEAIQQRICHLHFTREHHNATTYAASERLQQVEVSAVSHFIERATVAESKVLDGFGKRYETHRAAIFDQAGVKIHRLAETHGKLATFAESFADLVNLPESRKTELVQHIYAMAIERQIACASDHPVAAQFWEVCDYLEIIAGVNINHSNATGTLAINLNDVVAKATEHRQSLPPLIDLKRHLKGSVSRKFKEIRTVTSCINFKTRNHDDEKLVGKSVKCWVFQVGRDA